MMGGPKAQPCLGPSLPASLPSPAHTPFSVPPTHVSRCISGKGCPWLPSWAQPEAMSKLGTEPSPHPVHLHLRCPQDVGGQRGDTGLPCRGLLEPLNQVTRAQGLKQQQWARRHVEAAASPAEAPGEPASPPLPAPEAVASLGPGPSSVPAPRPSLCSDLLPPLVRTLRRRSANPLRPVSHLFTSRGVRTRTSSEGCYSVSTAESHGRCLTRPLSPQLQLGLRTAPRALNNPAEGPDAR